MNYKLNISYDGTKYLGWQIQLDKKTIQGEIENALSSVFNKKKINLIGSGRTDSGVHANNQFANFKIETKILPEQISKALNSHLNRDIYIRSCEIVDNDFNSRFSAIKRDYLYNITQIFTPFGRKYEWYIKWEIDRKILVKCSELILGLKDFSNFCKATSQKDNNQCSVILSEWKFSKNNICYKIEADRFIHHMVRLLVGTMIEVARGRITISNFSLLLSGKKSNIYPVRAPAKGLFLDKIHY